jgi:hypothetical protein
MDHIRPELDRIRAQMASHPHPNEAGLLYAIQRSLEWSLDPATNRSPTAMVTSMVQGLRDCCPTSHPESSERKDDLATTP